MAFTFDHTLGGSSSNSYVPLDSYTSGSYTILGANDYFDGHPKQEKWTDLTDTQKQQFLAYATTRLDTERYGGEPSTTTQRLQFPRSWIIDRNQQSREYAESFVGGDYYRENDKMPLELEYATFELAMFYIEEWYLEEPTASRQDIERMTSMSIGPLNLNFRKIRENELPDMVKRLLREIGPNGWMGERAMKLVRS